MSWETLNIRELIEQLKAMREATTSGNAGAFAVPLGGVLRPAFGAQDDYDPEEYVRGYSTLKTKNQAVPKRKK